MKRTSNEDDRRAVGYVRVSSQEQAQPDKPSLGQQEERIRSQCSASEWELVGLYRDVISGKEWERHQLVTAGLLKSDSPRGVWELSDEGWREARRTGPGAA